MASSIDGLSMANTYLSMMGGKASSAVESAASKDYKNAKEAELLEACKEFETYFAEQLFKSMRATIPNSEETESSYLDMFEDTLYQEYAKNLSDSGQLGLAQSLYEQMKRTYEV